MDRPGGERQAGQEGGIPLAAQVEVDPRHPRRLVAIVGAAGGLGQFGIDQHDPAQQANTTDRLAEDVPLDALVTLFAVEAENIGGIGQGARLPDPEQAEGGGDAAEIDLGAALGLFGLERCEDFPGIRCRGRGGRPLRQRLDVIGIKGNLGRDLDHQAQGRGHGALVVIRHPGAGRGIEGFRPAGAGPGRRAVIK